MYVSVIISSSLVFHVYVIDTINLSCYFKEWEAHTGIRIEGNFLTCEYVKHRPGARYLKSFSKEFPHFEVSNNTDQSGNDNDIYVIDRLGGPYSETL